MFVKAADPNETRKSKPSGSCCTFGNLCSIALPGFQRAPFHGLVTVALWVVATQVLKADLWIQGSHKLSGQFAPALRDPHKDVHIDSLSTARCSRVSEEATVCHPPSRQCWQEPVPIPSTPSPEAPACGVRCYEPFSAPC